MVVMQEIWLFRQEEERPKASLCVRLRLVRRAPIAFRTLDPVSIVLGKS